METKKLLLDINKRVDQVIRILDTITIDLYQTGYVNTQEGEILNEDVMQLTAEMSNFGGVISAFASTKEEEP